MWRPAIALLKKIENIDFYLFRCRIILDKEINVNLVLNANEVWPYKRKTIVVCFLSFDVVLMST